MCIRKSTDEHGNRVDHYWRLVEGKIDRQRGVQILDGFEVKATLDLDRYAGREPTLKRASTWGVLMDRIYWRPLFFLADWWFNKLTTAERISIIAIITAALIGLAAIGVQHFDAIGLRVHQQDYAPS